MSWTTPKTWAVGETLTAANFNAQFRDNLLAAGPHLIVRKTSDETVTSSTALQNDDHLILPLGANEAWEFRFQLVIASGGTPDFRMGFTFPASTSLYCAFPWGDGVGAYAFNDFSGTTSPTGNLVLFVPTSLVGIEIPGTIVTGGTSGNLTLQWAQGTSSGTGTTVKANSALWAVKLA